MSEQWQPQQQWNPYEPNRRHDGTRPAPDQGYPTSPGQGQWGNQLPAVPEQQSFQQPQHLPPPYPQQGSPYPQQGPYLHGPYPQQTGSTVVVQNHGSPKSVGVAIVLALFFGPLGMLYATVVGAIVMFLINLVLIFLTGGLGLFLSVPAGVIWAAVAASQTNRSTTVVATTTNLR